MNQRHETKELTVTRGVRGGDNRERRGRGKLRNINRGITGTNNRVGIDCWSSEGQGRSKEEKGGTIVTEQ